MIPHTVHKAIFSLARRLSPRKRKLKLIICLLQILAICGLFIIFCLSLFQAPKPSEPVLPLTVSVRCNKNGIIHVDIFNQLQEDVDILSFFSFANGAEIPIPHLQIETGSKSLAKLAEPINGIPVSMCYNKIKVSEVYTLESKGIYIEPVDFADYLTKKQNELPLILPYTFTLRYELQSDSEHPMRDTIISHLGDAGHRLIGFTESFPRMIDRPDDFESSSPHDFFESFRTIIINDTLRIEK